MSWGGSPSCGFDLVNSDGSEHIPEWKKETKKERLLNWLECFYLTARHRNTPDNDDARTSGAKRAYKEIQQLIKNQHKEDEVRMNVYKEMKCRECRHFCYQIHHASYCSHKPPIRKGVKELHDGRAIGCDKREAK